jgi:hypothetical protein
MKENKIDYSIIPDLSLKNLHRARNEAQHHGIVPCYADVQRYAGLTIDVLSNLSRSILNKDFNEISLAELIQDPLVRVLYKKGEDAYWDGDYVNALVYTASAFEKAKQIEQNKLWGSGLILTAALGNNLNNDFSSVLIEELEILKLRLDYKRYQKYREIFLFTLKPFLEIDSNSEALLIDQIRQKLDTTIKIWKQSNDSLKDQAIYCLSFTLDSIFLWESVDRTGWSEVISSAFNSFKNYVKESKVKT